MATTTLHSPASSPPDADRTVRTDTRLIEAIEAGTMPDQLLICGPAGTGKTFGVLTFLHLLMADWPGMRVLACRKTRAALTESVCVTYEQEILPADGMEGIAVGVKRRVRQSYLYPNGSEFVLGGLDNPSRILSTAWDIVFVNEAVEVEEDDWETIASRMARPGRRSDFGYLIGDTNPGPPNHWLKARCDRGLTSYWDTRHEANPRMYNADADAWTEEGLAYLATLDGLTGTRRKRLRDGLWAVGEGLWFEGFDPDIHVTEDADYDPALPVYLGCDPGVFTGAVAFQVKELDSRRFVNVVADYLAEGRGARENARAIQALLAERCDGKLKAGYCDPSGGARNPIGPTVLSEYKAAGLSLYPWASANPSVADSLTNVEMLLVPVNGVPSLTVHPRCRHLIDAFAAYKRAKRVDQWIDAPEDPQHPAEDVIDSLRGGLWPFFGGRKVLKFL